MPEVETRANLQLLDLVIGDWTDQFESTYSAPGSKF